MSSDSNASLTRLPAALFASLLLSAASPAYADPSQADRDTARNAVIAGRDKLNHGDPHAALELFQKAHAIMHVPTTGLFLARAQEALGQLLHARATALEVTQIPLVPDENQAFTDARKAAAEKIEQLDKRIPSLVLRINGAPREALLATVDGTRIPMAELSSPRKLDPGPHEVVIKAPGYPTVRRTVTLKDGEAAPVEVPVTLVSETVVGPAGTSGEMGWRRWAILGTGGVAVMGLGVGVGLHVAANAKLEEAKSQGDAMQKDTPNTYHVCGTMGYPGNKAGCDKLLDTLHTHDTLARGALAGYVVGGAAAAGTVLLLAWPKLAPQRTGVLIAPVLGSQLAGATVSGTF
jgi:hypothetical protein